MFSRIFLHFAVALLLLLGQQGASLHALSHLAEALGGTAQEKHLPHSPACEKCAAYAQTDAALPGTVLDLPARSLDAAAPLPSGTSVLATPGTPYATRAPPAFPA